MKLLLSLAISCALFSAGFPLSCYQCTPDASGNCTNTVTSCMSSQPTCVSTTATVYTGTSNISKISTKFCSVPQQCVSGSISLLGVRTTLNTNCCSTDLCNSQTLPEWPQNSLNGRQCYACNTTSCLAVLNCSGNEDRCITVMATVLGTRVMVKGCVSPEICSGAMSQLGLNASAEINCCQGNLCNDARRIIQNILLLLVPLVSIVLIH
ncbi:urokinase plasminogen activator surface receptor-like isoform X1 [Arapaima gigas]